MVFVEFFFLSRKKAKGCFLRIGQFCLSNQVLDLLKPTGVVPTQTVEAFGQLYFFQEILWVLANAIYKNTACILEPISFSPVLNS